MSSGFMRGAGVALVTPMNKEGEVDFQSLEQLVENQIAGGIDFLVALGTTAETSTLTNMEKQMIIDCVASVTQKRVPLMVGIGGNDTHELMAKLKILDLSVADAILSVVPYYNKPTQEGIFQHFKAIATSTTLPIMLYNVPGRTGAHMSAQTTIRLARESSQFMGVKEASGNLSEVMKILQDKPEKFALLSGDDNLIVPICALGGEGVISVAANAIPKGIANLTHYAMNSENAKAASLQLTLQKVIDMFFEEGNPAGVKAALEYLGICGTMVRLPLVPASKELFLRIENEMEILKRNDLLF